MPAGQQSLSPGRHRTLFTVCVLQKRPLGISYGVAGREFNVNELTVSTNKVSLSKHTVNKVL